MANRLDKVASDILSVNAAVKELSDRFDDYLFESAYGVLDTALLAGTRITTISLESALKGAIPVNAFFVISYPDGSNPLVIQNRKEELDTDTTDIEIYDDGTKDWEQDITPNVTYPVGSILSSVNYASNEGNLIGDLTGNVIFRINNDEGANIPAGSPIYSKGEIGQSDRIDVGICDANDSTKMPCIGIAMTTLTTTGDGAKGDAMLSGIFHTDITGFTSLAVGDILYIQNDGSLSQTKPSGEASLIQNVGVVLKTNGTGTTCQSLKVTAIGRTNDVPNLNENHLFIGDATNCAVSTNAPMVSIIKAADGDAARTLVNADPGGSGSGNAKQIQFNNNGDFDASSNLTFDTTTGTLSTTNLYATGITGTLGTGTTVATSPPANDDSKKIATTEWVLDNAGSQSDGSAGRIQVSDGSGGFGSSFGFQIVSGKLYAPIIDSNNYIKGIFKGSNIGTGIYAHGQTKYMYLGPSQFVNSNGDDTGLISSLGNYMSMPNASQSYTAEFQVPVQYKVTKVFVKGNANIPFSLFISGWSTAMGASRGSGTVNTELTLTSQLTSSEGDFYTIILNPSSANQRIYGCRLTLEEV